MQPKPYGPSFRTTFSILTSLLVLSGCLLNEETDPAEADSNNSGEILKSHELVGSVGDGPIISAAVNVTSADGESLGSVESDTTADFAVIVKTKGSHYPLRINATGGTDLVTMTAPDFALSSTVLKPGRKTIANLNPFTTIAMELATDLSGGATEENILAAIDVVVDKLGSGLDSLAVSGPLETGIDGGNIAEMIKSSEALGEAIRRTRDALRSVGRNVSGNGVVAALGSDLVDRVLDGRGGPRADARTAAVANVVLSQVMLEAMRNELRVQGSDAMARMDTAIGQVFSGTPSPALDELDLTSSMLDAAGIGILAASALQPSSTLDQIVSQLAQLQPGMSAAQVSSLLTADVSTLMDNLALAVANASAAEVESVNAVVRAGALPGTNRAPQIGGQPATSIGAGADYSFTPTATDADGDDLTFSIAGKPAWADFDTATGRLSGTPQVADVGTSTGIVISVSDGEESASLPAYTLTVLAAGSNAPPQISGTPASTVVAGAPYDFTPTASDTDGNVLTFSISAQPSWTTFNATTGRLQGTPDSGDVGTHGGIVISVSDGQANASLAPFAITVTAAPAANNVPQISGNPPSSVVANSGYSFTPQASDADGDALSFSVSALPSWAGFDTSTGRLSGTPGNGDVGSYNGITIAVSDGKDSTSLAPFRITVNAVTLGSATLSWTPPTENTDGSALLDLAGYRLYWGMSPGNYTDSLTINNPGLTTYVVENLAPGTYEFVSTAINSDGVESDYSNPATKTVP